MQFEMTTMVTHGGRCDGERHLCASIFLVAYKHADAV
jgi:hypothetical protein